MSLRGCLYPRVQGDIVTLWGYIEELDGNNRIINKEFNYLGHVGFPQHVWDHCSVVIRIFTSFLVMHSPTAIENTMNCQHCSSFVSFKLAVISNSINKRQVVLCYVFTKRK